MGFANVWAGTQRRRGPFVLSQAPAGSLNANYFLFIDEVDITDPFTARALLLIDRSPSHPRPSRAACDRNLECDVLGSSGKTMRDAVRNTER